MRTRLSSPTVCGSLPQRLRLWLISSVRDIRNPQVNHDNGLQGYPDSRLPSYGWVSPVSVLRRTIRKFSDALIPRRRARELGEIELLFRLQH